MQNGPATSKKRWFETKSEGLAWLFGFLSFVADIYTVGQIFNWLPAEWPVIPWAAGLIWLLALFTYLALMHDHWEKIRSQSDVSQRFLYYMIGDLVLSFREPWRTLPLVLLLVLLYPVGHSLGLDSSIWPAVMAVGFLLGLLKLSLLVTNSDRAGRSQEGITVPVRNQVVADWPEWEKRIRAEFVGKNGVVWADLRDMAEVKGYGEEEGRFIFAYYASKHPKTTRYGTLWRPGSQSGTASELVAARCLVKLDWLREHPEFKIQ